MANTITITVLLILLLLVANTRSSSLGFGGFDNSAPVLDVKCFREDENICLECVIKGVHRTELN